MDLLLGPALGDARAVGASGGSGNHGAGGNQLVSNGIDLHIHAFERVSAEEGHVLIAWFVILMTGRYPRPLFDFVSASHSDGDP